MAYTKVGHFNSRLEAETIGNALTQYDIPFLVRSEDVGIFGPGYTGATPLGASLWVADALLQIENLKS